MQEKYNVTGMTCAACQARVQKSVSNLTGVQECNVNLLKNSMVVTYDDKNVNSGQFIAAVEKAGYGASLQQVKGKSAAQAVSPVDTAKKEYTAMRRRVIWSFVFTIPLFYISMGHMLDWPLPGVFLGTENSMIYALTLFLKEFRVRQAMKLLRGTDFTIADIASQVGYQTQGKFSSAFQSIVKMSPREYRKIQGIASSDPLAKTVMKNSGRLLPTKPNTNIKKGL